MTAKSDESFTQRLLCIAPLVFGGLFLEGGENALEAFQSRANIAHSCEV